MQFPVQQAKLKEYRTSQKACPKGADLYFFMYQLRQRIWQYF
jgi:hypothetical protein